MKLLAVLTILAAAAAANPTPEGSPEGSPAPEAEAEAGAKWPPRPPYWPRPCPSIDDVPCCRGLCMPRKMCRRVDCIPEPPWWRWRPGCEPCLPGYKCLAVACIEKEYPSDY